MSKLYLIVAKGKHRGTSIPVKGDLFFIGSDSSCQLRIEHRQMAEQHCAIVTHDNKVFVRDLGSGRLTTVNGRDVPSGGEWPLHTGDLLEVGPLQALVRLSESPLSQRNAEEWAARTLEEAVKKNPTTEEFKAPAAAAAMLALMGQEGGQVRGRLRVSLEEGVTVARLLDAHLIDEGEINLLKQELTDELGKAPGRVLLDLRNVRRLSSMAIGMLIGVARRLKTQGVNVALCHVAPDLMPVLEAVGLKKMMPCFPTKEAALEADW